MSYGSMTGTVTAIQSGDYHHMALNNAGAVFS
jgi:hypothetical protein